MRRDSTVERRETQVIKEKRKRSKWSKKGE